MERANPRNGFIIGPCATRKQRKLAVSQTGMRGECEVIARSGSEPTRDTRIRDNRYECDDAYSFGNKYDAGGVHSPRTAGAYKEKRSLPMKYALSCITAVLFALSV